MKMVLMKSFAVLFGILCSCSNKIEIRKIDSVKIYSMNWNSSFLIAQTPDMIVNNPHSVIIDSISIDLLNEFRIKTNNFILVNMGKIYFDCRISCLLFNGSTVDTLSLSKSKMMQYNAEFYEEDSVLLWRIAKELPDYQYQQLEIGRGIVEYDHYR